MQLLARMHRAPADGQTQILHRDEPDAYLSSQGQQDLLRILENFARPARPSSSAVSALVEREFAAAAPNCPWVADLT